MTIATETSSVELEANGSITIFDYPFTAYYDDSIKVYLDGALQTAGYTIDREDDDVGGSVIFSTAPADGVIVRIDRRIPFTQGLDLRPFGRFPAESVERALDEGVMIDQELMQRIEDVFNQSLSRIPAGRNDMEQILDMGGFEIINLGEPTSPNSAARIADVEQIAAASKGANFVQEEKPTTGLTQGVRWYKPSVPATYTWYISPDGNGQWVQEPTEHDPSKLLLSEFQVDTIAPESANNNTIFVSSANNLLSFKDANGLVKTIELGA